MKNIIIKGTLGSTDNKALKKIVSNPQPVPYFLHLKIHSTEAVRPDRQSTNNILRNKKRGPFFALIRPEVLAYLTANKKSPLVHGRFHTFLAVVEICEISGQGESRNAYVT